MPSPLCKNIDDLEVKVVLNNGVHKTQLDYIELIHKCKKDFPCYTVEKNLPANAGDSRDKDSTPGLVKSPWRRKWPLAPVFLPEKFHGQKSLVGSCSQSNKELDMTE